MGAISKVVASFGGSRLPLGKYVLPVGPAGSGCPFESIQSAVDFADALPPDFVNILVTPAEYDEDVLVRRDKVFFSCTGGSRSSSVNSISISDCTPASIAAFDASGDPTVLVQDAALPLPPRYVVVNDLAIQRAAGPAWVGDARAGLRILGAPVPGTLFAEDGIGIWAGAVEEPAAGGPGIYACNAAMVAVVYCINGCALKFYNVGQSLLFHTSMLGGSSPIPAVEHFFDSSLPVPGGDGIGVLGIHSMIGGFGSGLTLSGLDAHAFCFMCVVGSIDVETTAIPPPGEGDKFFGCTAIGPITMPNVGPLVDYYGGRYMSGLFGAGAGGFTGIVGANS